MVCNLDSLWRGGYLPCLGGIAQSNKSSAFIIILERTVRLFRVSIPAYCIAR